MRKIKLFLGGFTNNINSQNLNCRALAKHLNKDKFDIYTLDLSGGELSTVRNEAQVKVFSCFRPSRMTIFIGFLWGIWNCDVAYLPKSELWRFNRFLLRILRKKSFSTIEGILDKDNLDSAIEVFGNYASVIASRGFVTRSYAITSFLGQYNYKHHKIKVEPKTLYLGCDTSKFTNNVIKSGQLNHVVYIGRLKKRKGIYDFINLAQHFPELTFHIFGAGEEKRIIEKQIAESKYANIRLVGLANHETLSTYLRETDLHILPSRSEGFPKVILETAAAGVPSILYDDYGAREWITNGTNGWVVQDIDEIIAIIKDLKSHPQKLRTASIEALKLAESFDWKVRVKDWEETIEDIIKKPQTHI